jgi:hypothetical protein
VGVDIKPGTHLQSAVCEVEVIVVRAPAGDIDLRCGGHPMVPVKAARPEGYSVEAGFGKGTLLGKRYAGEAGALEVLCVKAGPSSLSIGDAPLAMKVAQPLPSSD